MRPKLAVWKFSSCDGCQLSVLDLEDELLALAETVEIAHFLEASRRVLPGPYDVSLVEGSVTTPEEIERIKGVRAQSGVLVTIGACATAGGIQALKNMADVQEYTQMVYANPAFIDTLATSTPIAAHVKVDFELRGCPVDKHQLLGVLTALIHGRQPTLPRHSVCTDCKIAGKVCVTVAQGIPCLGPVTHTGCGALCPGYQRGCFGCFGPSDRPETRGMTQVLRAQGTPPAEIRRLYRTFNAEAPEFAEAARALEEVDG